MIYVNSGLPSVGIAQPSPNKRANDFDNCGPNSAKSGHPAAWKAVGRCRKPSAPVPIADIEVIFFLSQIESAANYICVEANVNVRFADSIPTALSLRRSDRIRRTRGAIIPRRSICRQRFHWQWRPKRRQWPQHLLPIRQQTEKSTAMHGLPDSPVASGAPSSAPAGHPPLQPVGSGWAYSHLSSSWPGDFV